MVKDRIVDEKRVPPGGPTLEDRIRGGLIGAAVGDALGSPTECLHYQEIREMFGDFRCFEDLEAVASPRTKYLGWVTDDTTYADVLLDCILANDGQITAYDFAREWERLEAPVPDPNGGEVVRLERLHWLTRIPYYRNRLSEINKRELGQGEAPSTDGIMGILPVGLLCAGDPLKAELMAVDVTSVNQHGRPRDVAGGYAAAVAICFLPGATVEDIVKTGIHHTRDEHHRREITAMVDLARLCRTCEEFTARYYTEILGRLIPMQDWQHEGTPSCVTWNSAEVLGPSLATLVITRGQDAAEMMLACAKFGRDSDTITRVAGGLIGTYLGTAAIPQPWIQYVVKRNGWLRLEEKAARLGAIVRRHLEVEIQQRQAVLAQPGARE